MALQSLTSFRFYYTKNFTIIYLRTFEFTLELKGINLMLRRKIISMVTEKNY